MPLSPHLRDRILRQLDTLSDEKGYVVLDFVDYVATKYGAPPTSTTANLFSRFAEGIEDTLRAGRVSTTAISQTMGFLNQAVGVLNGVAAAGKSVASDIVTTASDIAKAATTPTTGTGGATDPNAGAQATAQPTPPPAPDGTVPPAGGTGGTPPSAQ